MEKALKIACKYFEQEMSHAPAFGGHKRWAKGESTTGHFWCKQTMGSLGPDTGPVNPDDCRKGRGCFLDT
jgi:hypothetical protein